MSLDLVPGQNVTFTVTRAPHREAQRKTIQRLMRMQGHIQRGLQKLAVRRRQKDNRPYRRAGKTWVDRARTTKLTKVAPGESFTLRLTPQIIPDIRSVEKFLEMKAAS